MKRVVALPTGGAEAGKADLPVPLRPLSSWVAVPSTPEEARACIEQLRTHYQPYLRSLSEPLTIRTLADLSGTWLWKCEVDDLRKDAVRPSAPDWYCVDFDDSGWEKTRVPEWRYDKSEPFGSQPSPKDERPENKIAWYRTVFMGTSPSSGHRTFLVFAGVTWEAEVWLNGVRLGHHSAYWEPFRFDVTSRLRDRNVLAIRVLSGPRLGEPVGGFSIFPMALAVEPRYERDAARSVVGQREFFGFKGACFNCGNGIHREVILETTGSVSVAAVRVRTDLRLQEARLGIDLDAAVEMPLALDVQLIPENFEGESYFATTPCRAVKGIVTVSLTVPMPRLHLWEPEAPRLYRCRILLRDGPQTIDGLDTLFGCRSFRLAGPQTGAPEVPEGLFLLNDHPVFLRGAGATSALNAFWYWRQDDKLLDTVLLAKAAGFNMFRACEHVQFREVRELLDRLGMLSEQDLGTVNRAELPRDAIPRLAASIERECYNNPGVVLLCMGMETDFDPTEAVQAILEVNPERIVKPIAGHMREGDFSYGLPPDYPDLPPALWDHVVNDFNTYAGWYCRGAELWKLGQCYPDGRMVTVGEFGAESLDSYEAMLQYPPHLRPPPITEDVLWGHAQVRKGDPKLTVGLRGRKPVNLGEYIQASQNYHADVLAEQSTVFRLSPRRIAGYAVFHLLDGVPAWWQKSIVSFNLHPKQAYYAMAQVNQPVVALFQLVEQGRTLAVWVANDRPAMLSGARVGWSLTHADRVLLHGAFEGVEVSALDATVVGTVDLSPLPPEISVVTIVLALSDAAGRPVSSYRREVFLPAFRPLPVEVRDPPRSDVPRLPDAGGRPTCVDWTRAASLSGWKELEGQPTAHGIEALIGHDASNLYVKLARQVLITIPQIGGVVWEGENWELFFARQQARPYRQFGFNPKGSHLEVSNGAALPSCGVTVVSERTPDRWTVFLAFPLSAIVPGGVKSGDVFYGNFCANVDSGLLYREWLAWSPTYRPGFHVPERFGELTLQ